MLLICMRMLVVSIRMSVICIRVFRMLLVCFSYSMVTRTLLVCYSYVTRMLLVRYFSMLLIVLVWCFSGVFSRTVLPYLSYRSFLGKIVPAVSHIAPVGSIWT